MNAIFISQIECYLRVNGNFVGTITSNSKVIYNFEEDSFLEFIPISDNFLPSFYYKKRIDKVKKYLINEDVVFIPVFEKKRNLKYEILFQRKVHTHLGDLLITCVADGSYKYYLDGLMVFSGELPVKPQNIEATILNNVLLVFFYGETTLVFAFSLSNGQLIFQDYGNNVELSNTLNIYKEYKTIIPTSVLYKWKIEDKITLYDKESNLKKSVYDINSNLLGQCFLELLCIGGNANSLTSPNLIKRQKELIEFVGKPYLLFPYYKDPLKIVGVYENSISLYNFTIENNLIDNIVDEIN